MDEYFDVIFNFTKEFVDKSVRNNNYDDQGALLSIEVWNFIFEAELSNKQNTG
jgi:hypothetical protein